MRVRILLAFAAIYLIWGSTYLAIAFAVRELPPLFLAGIRSFIAGAILYGWLRLRGAAAPERARWRETAIVGLLLLGIGNGAVTWATRTEPSGVVSLVVALVPLWLLVFGWIGAAKDRPRRLESAGVALGLLGIVLLVAPGSDRDAAISVGGLAVLLLGTIAWSVGSLYARGIPARAAPLLGTGMEMLTGGGALLLGSLLIGEWPRIDPGAVTPRGVASVAYLIIFGSIVGFSSYKWLLTRVRPALAGSYAFVNPVIAVLLGTVVAGERLDARILLAMAMIVGAVAAISLRSVFRAR